MKIDDAQINIVVSQKGVEKVQIFGGVDSQNCGIDLYNYTSEIIKFLDRAVKEKYSSS